MAKKKKKTKWIIILVILGLLLGAGGVFAYSQANNIKALAYMKKYSPEEREALAAENEEAVQKIMEKMPEAQVKPLSEEDQDRLKNGEITEEEALGLIMGKELEDDPEQALIPDDSAENQDAATEENDQAAVETGQAAAPEKSDDTAPKETEAPKKDDAKLQRLLAQVYLLRSSFSGQIDGLVSQAKSEVIASGSKDNIYSIGKKYINMGVNLEAQCDAQMNSILGEIRSELQTTGGDPGIVAEIRSAYQNEKSIKKAALLGQYY